MLCQEFCLWKQNFPFLHQSHPPHMPGLTHPQGNQGNLIFTFTFKALREETPTHHSLQQTNEREGEGRRSLVIISCLHLT